MKKTIVIALMIFLVLPFGTLFAKGQQEGPAEMETETSEEASEASEAVEEAEKEVFEGMDAPESLKSRFSYAFGYLSAQNFAQQGIDVDVDYFTQAMKDAIYGEEPLLTVEAMNQALQEYQAQIEADQQATQQAAAEENMKKANEILEANRANDDISETESGLQYEVLEAGDESQMPEETDVVKVHYEGTLTDGQVFDSSYERYEPVTFPLNGVIPGWTEGLQLMSVGSTYRFYIPPQLGYGETGSAPVIGPNELLIFKVELLAINPEDTE